MFGHLIAIAALLSASMVNTVGKSDCAVRPKDGTKSQTLRAMARIPEPVALRAAIGTIKNTDVVFVGASDSKSSGAVSSGPLT